MTVLAPLSPRGVLAPPARRSNRILGNPSWRFRGAPVALLRHHRGIIVAFSRRSCGAACFFLLAATLFVLFGDELRLAR